MIALYRKSRNARKRSFNNISREEDEVDESDEDESYEESYAEIDDDEETCFDEPTPENSSNDIIFDFVEFLHHGKPKRKLLIFTSPERTHCYEFEYHRTATKYRCLQCLAQEQDTVINAKIHFNGSKTYDFNINEHVCEPIVYLPENYQTSLIIKSPNFKFEKRFERGKIRPYLFIFNSRDRNMCYKFGFDCSNRVFRCLDCRIHNISIHARYIQHNEENAIEFNRLNHLCQPKRYTP
uniref:Transposase n=1 Tax=Panagrolaimus davidi TaxID=227884 RepID=A0A914QTZ1_9BILA